MTEFSQEFSSKTQAAILFKSLDKEVARKVFDELSSEEQGVLVSEIGKADSYTIPDANQVIVDYLNYFEIRNSGAMENGEEYIRDLFGHLPAKELDRLINRAMYARDNPFDFLQKSDDLEPVVTYLSQEDAQTIAVVSTYLQPQQSAKLMESLPQEKATEVMYSIASLGQIDNDLVRSISDHLRQRLTGLSNNESSKRDGVKEAVSILNNVPRSMEKMFLERFDIKDKELADVIRENMFVFENLTQLTPMDLQKVINGVSDDDTIAKAIKGASEELKDLIYQSMSEGRRVVIEEVVEGLGALKMSDAETAQQQIANKVKEMEKEEKIVIQRGDEDVII